MSSQKLEHNTELCKCVTDTYQEAQNSQKIQTKICKKRLIKSPTKSEKLSLTG